MHVSFVVVEYLAWHMRLYVPYNRWKKKIAMNEGWLKMSLFDVDPKYHGLTNEMTFGQFDHLEIIWKSL